MIAPQETPFLVDKPVIISCAITGSITTRDKYPQLPVTPKQIVDSAVEAAEAGAAIVHIHVREDDGTPSPRPELYEEVFNGIRQRCDALICATTATGGGRFSEEERLAALSCDPDLASFDAGSMNFGPQVFENSPEFLRKLATAISTRGILAEIECFDLGMIANALRLGSDGLLPGGRGTRWWFQFCLGVKGGAPFGSQVIAAMRSQLPPDSEWSVLGVGKDQLPAALVALCEGGHVRTGVEDNVYFRKGVLASSNAQLVRRVADIATELDRPIASPADARSLLGLEGVTPVRDAATEAGPARNESRS